MMMMMMMIKLMMTTVVTMRIYQVKGLVESEEERQGGVLDRGRNGLLKGSRGVKNIEMENCSQDNCGNYVKILR